MSKSTLKILTALMIAIAAALVTQPMRAQVPFETIVFTENSSTSLSVTINASTSGITVLNTSPDHWTITLPATIANIGGLNTGWTEPENPGQINYLTSGSAANELFIASDFTPTAPVDLFQNGALSNGIASDNISHTHFVGMFTDLAAASEAVPDTGTTASLFGLSLMGLAFLRRKFC
jgi:hypothetical protein